MRRKRMALELGAVVDVCELVCDLAYINHYWCSRNTLPSAQHQQWRELFGFEFTASNRVGCFIELGGMGMGAKADKIQSKPVFSNGFTTSTGLRFLL